MFNSTIEPEDIKRVCRLAVREADRAKLAIVIYYMITDEPETAPLS